MWSPNCAGKENVDILEWDSVEKLQIICIIDVERFFYDLGLEKWSIHPKRLTS